MVTMLMKVARKSAMTMALRGCSRMTRHHHAGPLGRALASAAASSNLVGVSASPLQQRQRFGRDTCGTRSFSSSSALDEITVMPLFASESVRETIQQGLGKEGYCIINNFAGADVALKMRGTLWTNVSIRTTESYAVLCSPSRCAVCNRKEEAECLYEEGHMFQSMSGDEHGQAMPKKNVFATELDGNEWDIAPTLLDYTRSVLLQAPIVLNHFFPHLQMSQRTYGTKLAVSLGAGSKYPKHCDNSGLPDQRKVTMVYYLNPSWEPSQGGELRIYTKNDGIQVVSPVADTLAMFWSDQIVHDVLPTMNDITAKDERRYALTLWLVSDNQQEIVNPKDPLYPLRQTHFPSYE